MNLEACLGLLLVPNYKFRKDGFYNNDFICQLWWWISDSFSLLLPQMHLTVSECCSFVLSLFPLTTHTPWSYSALSSTHHLPFFHIFFSFFLWRTSSEDASHQAEHACEECSPAAAVLCMFVWVCVCVICPAVSSETTAKQAQFVKSREV